jgi:transglycosylase-like protein with SLT domain
MVACLGLVVTALLLARPAAGTHRSEPCDEHSLGFCERTVNHYAGEVRRLRQLASRRISPGYRQLIRVASVVYRVPYSTLYSKAKCESVNFTDFYNESSGASGVMQFLPSTFRSTPFSSFSIFNPVANVFAGAWMHARGRGGEWECR